MRPLVDAVRSRHEVGSWALAFKEEGQNRIRNPWEHRQDVSCCQFGVKARVFAVSRFSPRLSLWRLTRCALRSNFLGVKSYRSLGYSEPRSTEAIVASFHMVESSFRARYASGKGRNALQFTHLTCWFSRSAAAELCPSSCPTENTIPRSSETGGEPPTKKIKLKYVFETSDNLARD